MSPHTKHHHTKLHYTTTKHKHTHTNTHTNKHQNTHTHTHKNHTHHAVSHAGCHNLAIRELLFFLFYSILLVFVSLYYCILFSKCIYVYTHIVVFGILMEFVLYATIIAGTTKTPTQHFSLCRHRDDDHYVFFIPCL